jgi:carboxypeptidase D
VQVFPSLAERPFHLIGESYAGQYIVSIDFWPGLWNIEHCTPQPYITKALFSSPEPPVKLSKIVIGNGAIGSFALYEEVSAVCFLHECTNIGVLIFI